MAVVDSADRLGAEPPAHVGTPFRIVINFELIEGEDTTRAVVAATLYSLDVNVDAGTSTLIRSYDIDRSAIPPSTTFDGIAVVGDTIYVNAYSGASFPGQTRIFRFDAATGASSGFIQAQLPSPSGLDRMVMLAWAGANFWTAGSSGNVGYQVDLTGRILNTIRFSESRNVGLTGLEYFNGTILANDNALILQRPNRFSAYTPQGELSVGGYFTSFGGPVAFDGADFLVAGIGPAGAGRGFYVYDGTTRALEKFISNPDVIGSVRDISVDYTQRADLPTSTVPEAGSSFGLFAGAMFLVAIARRRRIRRSGGERTV